MVKGISLKAFGVVLLLALFLVGCAHTRPPKPGANFIWMAKHTNKKGLVVHGHWKYVGPRLPDKTWVAGHYSKQRRWVPGYWRPLDPTKGKGKVWVSGRRGPRGHWVPGHWR